MTAADRLDEIEARADAATDGPWITGGSIEEGVTRFGTLNDPDDPSEPGVLLGDVAYEANAEFIAHARADVPRLVAALRAVLDMHSRDYFGECAACPSDVAAPCPTVRAVEAVLGEVAP